MRPGRIGAGMALRLAAVALCALAWGVRAPDAGAQALPLEAQGNPHRLESLGPIEPGRPLFPRHRGHVPYGLTDTAWATSDESRRLTASELGLLHEAMGATMVRVPVFWPELEPGPGARHWTRYDELYRALIRHGVRPLWTLYQTPRHHVEPLRRGRCRGVHCDDEPAAGSRDALSAVVRDLAARYPLSAAFEYRNEPNVSRESANPVIPAERYVAGLRAFHAGAKAGRRESRVLGLALAMDGDHREYLAAALRAGAGSAMDALSFHPYWTDARPDTLAHLFADVRDVLVAHGRSDLRLVPDEAGASVVQMRYGLQFDEPGQRDRMLAWFRLLDGADPSIPLSGQIDAAVMFTTVDGPPGDPIGGYGWFARRVEGVLRPRPVFCAFREQIAGLPPFTGLAPFGACPQPPRRASRRKVLRSCPSRRSRNGKVCRCRTVRLVVRGRRKTGRRCGYVVARRKARSERHAAARRSQASQQG